MESVSPVFTEAEVQFEQKIAEHQEEYAMVIGLPVTLQLVDRESGKRTLVNPWGMSFRFRLSGEERAAVASGKDLILTQLNFGKPVTPMNIQFCGPGEKPVLGEVPPPAKTFDDAIAECEELDQQSIYDSTQPQLQADYVSLNEDGSISVSTKNDETIHLIDPIENEQ